jgi:DNA-binding NtrC family response regulator
MGKTILIVDDEPLILSSLASFFAREGFDPVTAESGARALAVAEAQPPDLVLLDLVLGDMDGLDVLRKLREHEASAPPVILLTAHGSIDSAVAAMKAGAYDFIRKPFDLSEVLAAARNALRTRSLETRVRYLESDRRGPSVLVGESELLRAHREEAKEVARGPYPRVLLLGESGSGKSLVARLLHEQSDRALGQFVEVNCAAYSDEQLEAELFGAGRTASSDARARREGLVEIADGGTLLLDEIADMGPKTQARLVSFLEDQSFRRAGSGRPHRVDVRLVAATGQDLRARAEDGRFRADLFYRLGEMTLVTPPLRERPEDVIPLARHFLEEASRTHRRRFRGFTSEAETLLRGYRWPGNVRELMAVINRVTLTQDGERIGAAHLPPEIAAGQALEEPQLPAKPGDGPIPTLEEVELAYIRRVLALCGGNKLLAARYLGIARQTLARRLSESESPAPVVRG